MKYYFRSKSDGFTLLEVLVSIVVFSFGLLGVAGMMTISVRNNHNGYLRSQANFLAENMVDRMSANPVALWNDTYNGVAANGSHNCIVGQECNYNDLAVFDMQQWALSVSTLLPAGEGEIDCQSNSNLPTNIVSANPPSIWFPTPPYDGICTVTVTWNESNETGVRDEQTLVLVTQP